MLPSDWDPGLLAWMQAQGDLLRVRDRWMEASLWQDLHRRLQQWFDQHPELTLSQFRQLLDVSRKYAVPLAEYLDLHHVTRRQGDVRRPGPRLGDPGVGAPHQASDKA